MGRIPDHLVSLAVRALENRWVTIGAKVGKNTNGKKKGGTPVELDGEGKITKGPAALTGKRPSELSQSLLFTGQDHKSQRKLFAEPGDPPPPPPIEETPKAPPAAAKKEPKPRAKKPLSMSLLAVIRREGGISSGDFEHTDFKEFGLLGALNKKGLSLDDMAATMVRQGHITVPMGKSSPSDHLLQLLKKKTNSLLAADTAEYDKDYTAYMQAREEAQADGYEEGQLEEVRGRGEEAGGNESKDRLFEEIFGGDGSGGREAGRDEEPGDLAGDASEPASGLDTSFDFGPAAAPKVEEKPKATKQDKPAPATTPPPPPPATNLFGQPEPTKPQPATTQGLFGTQVPVEDPKLKPRETVADQAEKGLDWLYQKQDPKTDGTGEMFGGLFSPGRTSGATEPEAGPVAPPAVEPSATAAKPKVTPPAPKTPYAQRRGSVNFSPVTGPTGHKLVGYNWEHDKVDMVDDRGENRTRKVSAWDRSTQADETNRPIVHNFTVEAPDGTTKTVSLETAARMLGFDSSGDEPKAKFQSAVSAAKTLAKMQMDRADLMQRADRWQKDKADVDRQVEALPDDQIEEVPDTMGRPDYRVFRWKNQPEISVRRRMNQPEADREEGKRQVRWALADSEMEKRGHKEKNFKPNTVKIDGDIKKAQEKLDNLTKQASQTKPEAGPAAPPPVEPSPPATNPKATSLPDRIKNLNVLLNKTRSSANAKALRTAIAQLEREAGPAAPPAVSERKPAEPATKPTHEMTKAEFQKAYMDKANELLTKAKERKIKDVMGVAGKAIAELGGDHFEQIKKARAAGKAIPQEVLADYPYLKEPHEMSQQEWAAKWLASSPGRAPRDIDMDLVKLLRKADVKRAIDAGKQVPASVLKDYPELKPGTENYEPLDDREDPSKSSFWLNQKTQLEKTKPRPLNKLYGPSPTPEQVAYHQELMKTWNSKNRNAEKKRKELREIEDAAYRKKMTTESRTLSTIRQQLREAFRQCP